MYVKTFDAGYRLLMTNYMIELLQKNGSNVYELNLNVVPMVVVFEMFSRSQGLELDYRFS